MALQLGALRDALLDAGAQPDRAAAAAEEVAAYETRLGGVEAALGALRGEVVALGGKVEGQGARLTILTWAVGLNFAATLAVLARLLTH